MGIINQGKYNKNANRSQIRVVYKRYNSLHILIIRRLMIGHKIVKGVLQFLQLHFLTASCFEDEK